MAGIGGGDPALVAAVSNAGALGMLGAGRTSIKVLEPVLHALRSLVPDGRFGVNFLGPFLVSACVELAALEADVVEFFYETPCAKLYQDLWNLTRLGFRFLLHSDSPSQTAGGLRCRCRSSFGMISVL